MEVSAFFNGAADLFFILRVCLFGVLLSNSSHCHMNEIRFRGKVQLIELLHVEQSP